MNDVDLIWTQLQLLFDDLASDDHFPKNRPLLAHYSSIETVENILRNNEVWFSNPLFMNDVEELRFGINEGISRFYNSKEIKGCLSDSQRHLLFQHFENYSNEFTNDHGLDIYAFCLSKHDKQNHSDGLLSMWRGYGSNGHGAAIVFDTAQLTSLPSSPLIIAPVMYGTKQERVDWIDNKLIEFSVLLKKLNLNDEQLYLAANAIFERIKLFSIFTKHNGFSEEQEWRVAYIKSRDKESRLLPMLSYSIGSSGVEPRLKLKLEPIDGLMPEGVSLSNFVHQIILGPSVSSPLAKAAFDRMLEQIGKPELKSRVLASTIPFRHVRN